jgi:hypothetical protein
MLVESPRPLVSVIIPAFNAAGTIDDALSSVVGQTYPNVEVFVVDDGSADATADVAARWGTKVTVVRQSNRGPGAARNAGLARANGSLVAFLDADDVWLPGKLASQVEYFGRFPETGLLHTDVLTVRSMAAAADLSIRQERALPPRPSFCQLFHTDLDINTLTVMAPRELLVEAGGFDEHREIHVEDWDLWLRVAARAPVGHLPWPTAVRRPGGSMSAAVEKTFRGQAAVIDKLSRLCPQACASHRSDPSACLHRRWHRLHWESGYARMREGRHAAAGAAFARAIRHRPFDASGYLQLAALAGGRQVASALRRVRPAARRSTSTPMVRDTVYWRGRHALVNALHGLDDLAHRVRSGDRVRVLFDAASPMSFTIFSPVYERLRLDPRFEFWFTATGATWDAGELYTRVGIGQRVVGARRASMMKVDLCVNTDFWDMTWLHRRTRRMHFFHGVAGKYGLDAPVELAPTISIFDRLMFPNADRLERYVGAGLVDGRGPVPMLVGYPKLDRLVDGSLDRDQIAARLGLDRAPTVLYAPTWSPYSSLNSIGERVIAELARSGFNVVVKLHDRSFDRAVRGSGGIDWAARLSAFDGNPRVRIVSDPDATPCFVVADAMVTDHSSIGFEFALMDRPLVVVDCPQLIAKARVTPSKVTALRAAAELADTPSGVVAAVLRQLEEPSLHSRERQCLSRAFFYRPGTATDRAVAAVYELLGIAAPEHERHPEPISVVASVGRR